MHSVIETLLNLMINAFIICMLFWMIFWDLEQSNPIRKHWIPKIQRLFFWLGLHGQWQMFAPDPPRRTIWPMAKITLNNLETTYWEPMPYAKMNGFEKMKLKKFHNYFHDMVRPQSGEQLKQDFAKYLLRKKKLQETCIKVEIYLMAQPTQPFHAHPSQKLSIDKQLVYTFDPIGQK